MTAIWSAFSIARQHEGEDMQDGAADPASDLSLRLGGMALSNGLILVSARHWAAAIRENDGSISAASGKKPVLPGTGERAVARDAAGARRGGPAGGPAGGRAGARGGGEAHPGRVGARAAGEARGGEGIPMIRGLGRLAESMMVLGLVKKRLPGARLPFESKRMARALAASMAGASAVRVVAPRSALVQEAGSAVAAFIPAVLAIKDSPISGYHGAEHKVIGARERALRAAAAAGEGEGDEAGEAGDVMGLTGDAAAAPKEHERCGSNLVGPFLFASVLANVLARDRQGRKTPLRSAVAGAASLGAALEALRWADRHEGSLTARVMMWPGKVIQKGLTTSEPTPEQLEVGERALAELLRLEAEAV